MGGFVEVVAEGVDVEEEDDAEGVDKEEEGIGIIEEEGEE